MGKAKLIKKMAAESDVQEAPSALGILNALPDIVIGFNDALRVSFSNHAAQSFFRLGEKQFLEKKLAALLGAENPALLAAETAAGKKMTVTLHDVNIGGKTVSSVVAAPAEAGFHILQIRPQPLSVAGEWSEKTRYSLQSAERVAETLAHEIKNPIAGIRGAAQLLCKSGLNSEDRELAGLIEYETGRIQTLIDRFQVFHEVPQSRYIPVNLHEVLHHVIKVAKAAYGQDIVIVENFDPSLPDIRGHFDHLVQAALNLIKNAAEACGEKGGRIGIRTFYDNTGVYHPERPEKLPITLEIEDDGEGIPVEALSRIFQPYFTTKKSGQGLGLPIVSRIVDDHGGIIQASSSPGSTVVRINFPLLPSKEKKS